MTIEAMSLAHADAERSLTRGDAAMLLGMSDTEFALQLIWDLDFPRPLDSGFYRLGDILAWMDAQTPMDWTLIRRARDSS